MREKEQQAAWLSGILGVSLFLALFLLLVSSFVLVAAGNSGSVWTMILEMCLKIGIFLLPMLFVRTVLRRRSIPAGRAHIMQRPAASRAVLIGISSVGFILVAQMLYGAVFPSSLTQIGVDADSKLLDFLLLFLLYAVTPAVMEELFFRGTVMRQLLCFPRSLAILISSLVFALMHISLDRFPIAFVCGLVLGTAYLSTGSLALTVTVHLVCNAFWYAWTCVSVFFPAAFGLFRQISFCCSVLMLAVGLPFLKATFGMIFTAEDEDTVSPSCFWTAPMVLYLIMSVAVPLVLKQV